MPEAVAAPVSSAAPAPAPALVPALAPAIGTDVIVAGLRGPVTVDELGATLATLHAQRAATWHATVVVPSPELMIRAQQWAHPRVTIHLDRDGRGWCGALASGRAPRVIVLDAGDELTGLDALARLDLELSLSLIPEVTVLYTDEMLPGPDGIEARWKPGFTATTAVAAPIYHRLGNWPRALLEQAIERPTTHCPETERDGTGSDAGVIGAGERALRRAVIAAAGLGAKFVHVPAPSVRGRLPIDVMAPPVNGRRGGSAPAQGDPRPGEPAARDVPADIGEISVIIPTAGGRREIEGSPQVLVFRCLAGLLQRTHRRVAEVVVVLGDNAPPGLRETLEGLDDRIRSIHVPGPFSFTQAVNTGAASARHPWLLLLNDDVEILTDDWLDHLFDRAASVDRCGPVGAKLLFPDGRIQHAGVAHHDDGTPLHLAIFEDDVVPGEPTSRFGLVVPTPFDGVTGAVMLVRTDDFDLVGGLSPQFPINFQDIDFCLKLACLGRVSQLVPAATLVHRESSTRIAHVKDSERSDYLDRWADLLRVGPLRQWHVP